MCTLLPSRQLRPCRMTTWARIYQYEVTPGSMIVFLGGDTANLDQSVRDLETGIARLRGATLCYALIDEAKRSALGDYYLGATTLERAGLALGPIRWIA